MASTLFKLFKLKHYISPSIILTFFLLFLVTNYIFFTIYIFFTVNYSTFLHHNLMSTNKPDWYKIVAREFRDKPFNIGLVNMDRALNIARTKAKTVRVDFIHASERIEWKDMAPERIEENSTCPDIPMPRFQDYHDLDVIVSSVDHCKSKDVIRLQVNLVVANLLVRSGRRSSPSIYAVFIGSCGPMWEIFRCNDLVWNQGNAWVYKPELARIRKLILMPFGPCQFVPPLSKLEHNIATTRNEGFVTVLHSSEDYVCGAIVLAQSILRSGTNKDLILLADENISPQSIEALRAAGWKTERIERIRSPYSKKNTYNEWNYSKLRIWQLTQYQKLMFIDADLVVNKNIDELFAYPQLTAAGNYQKHFFNSGLMLVEPSQCGFETLMEKMMVVESYNGGDQGFLNEMFVWWHRLRPQTNYLKVFVDVNDEVHWVDEKEVYVMHYTGLKPWNCGDEERDCNWDVIEKHRYASSSAYKMWWNVYHGMPEDLKAYCSLYRPKKEKASYK